MSDLTPTPTTEDESIQRLVLQGDLGALTRSQQARYIMMLCEQNGLDWRNKPFDFITAQGKTFIYANRNCFDQLRKIHKINIKIIERVQTDQLVYVRAYAELPDGRCDEAIGAVGILGLKNIELANAYMKAETKAKRRVTQSIAALSLTDETELDSIPQVRAELQAPRRLSPGPAPEVGSLKTILPMVEDADIIVPDQLGAEPVAQAIPRPVPIARKLPPAVAPIAVKP